MTGAALDTEPPTTLTTGRFGPRDTGVAPALAELLSLPPASVPLRVAPWPQWALGGVVAGSGTAA